MTIRLITVSYTHLDVYKRQAIALSIVGGIVTGIAGILLTPSLLKMMNTPADVIEGSTMYLRIYFAGIIFVFVYNIGSGILRAVGDSKRPLYRCV